MALTIATDFKMPQKAQGEFLGVLTGTITFDNSYPTGGESLSGLSGKFKDLFCVLTDVKEGISTGYDRTNNKLMAYWVDTTVDGAAQAEVTDTTYLSTIVVSFVAYGRI